MYERRKRRSQPTAGLKVSRCRPRWSWPAQTTSSRRQRRAVRSDLASVTNDLASVRRDRSMMRRHLFAVMGDRSMTRRDLFAVKCDLIVLLNQLTTTRASCRGERRDVTIDRWHARRRPSDVSDRRRDLAANRCADTALPDDVQRSIGHVADRDHVLRMRGNDLASACDDLTSTFNDLTSAFNDLTSIPHDLMLASETLNQGNPVGAVGHVVCGRLFGRSSSYISRHGARNACSSVAKEVQGGGIHLDPPVGENAHPLRPLQSRMTQKNAGALRPQRRVPASSTRSRRLPAIRLVSSQWPPPMRTVSTSPLPRSSASCRTSACRRDRSAPRATPRRHCREWRRESTRRLPAVTPTSAPCASA